MVHLNHSMTAERLLRSKIGSECADTILEGSVGYPVPLPIAGTGTSFVDGIIMPHMAGGGFSSLSDLIAEASAGKQQQLWYQQTGVQTTAGTGESYWGFAGRPGPGRNPSALPGGSVPDRTTVGVLGQDNPAGGETLHLVSAMVFSNTAGMIIVYDRLWDGAAAMNTTASQSITGVPTRYTGTEAKGNVYWAAVRGVTGSAALSATAHNLTFGYTDQDGNTGASSGALTGVASAGLGRIDHPGWFAQFAAGDLGARALTSFQLSATIAAGQLDLVLARPLIAVPMAGNNIPAVWDGVNNVFNLPQIKDNAALALTSFKGTTATSTISGCLVAVSG